MSPREVGGPGVGATPTRDWRAAVLARMPEQERRGKMTTHTSLAAMLELAAYNRRMRPEDYAMRAVRAFVAHDLELDPGEIGETEPPVASILAPDVRRRWRGRGFGAWRITGLADV